MWDAKVGEWVISGILVQIKRRQTPGIICLSEIDEQEIGFFPEDSEIPDGSAFKPTTSRPYPTNRPYISLVMELATELPISTVKRSDTPSSPKRRRTTASPEPIKLHHPSHIFAIGSGKIYPISHTLRTHPRYNIYIDGCSSTSYGVIRDVEKSMYDSLIGVKDLLDDHPRHDAESIQAVGDMTQFFSIGDPSYHWLDCPELRKTRTDDSDLAGVLVGPFDGNALQRFEYDLQ